MSDVDAAEFLASYGLKESGLARLIRAPSGLLGLSSFFTTGEDECRAWTIPIHTRAVEAAGAIHSDLEKHFIRPATIRWDQLLEAGSEANARARGTLRLEGKDYIVQAGDVMHIRHSGCGSAYWLSVVSDQGSVILCSHITSFLLTPRV